jgi:hypothetical protein
MAGEARRGDHHGGGDARDFNGTARRSGGRRSRRASGLAGGALGPSDQDHGGVWVVG